MRVIHTVGGIAERLGGPSRTVTRLCSAIGRLGVPVDLVAGVERSRAEQLIRPEESSVKLHLVDSLGVGRLRYFPAFSRTLRRLLIEQHAPALIHDHGVWTHSNVAAWRVARERNVPYVLSPRGMLEPWALEFKARKKKMAWTLYQRRIVASASAVVATSEQECENVKRLLPNLPVAVIPNGVDWPAEPDVAPAAVRGTRGGTVLFMSRVHPKKNVLGLLRAWKSLDPAVAQGWRLVIAGPDEAGHARQVASLVQELGLQGTIELSGSVEEGRKAAIFNAADVFVLPSFSENFGVVVAEALAHGLPVIATAGTPWQELVSRGCGWWVDPDPASLVGALMQAMNCSPQERRTMGAAGRAYVRAQFSWDAIAQSTVALYEWLLHGGAPPPTVHR